METLLIILSIEGNYFWSRNTVFWDAFTAVSIADALWDFVPCLLGRSRRRWIDNIKID
jgi:hypothetical protein